MELVHLYPTTTAATRCLGPNVERSRIRRQGGRDGQQNSMPTNVSSTDQLGGSRPKALRWRPDRGGCSLHDAEKPEFCQKHLHAAQSRAR